ncbi:MAG: protecting protein DprA [Sphingomonas bacterium]|nr:protecting protein DprA [Sphingomonas bacterium]
MSDPRIARLRLVRTPTIGPITYRQLLARFDSAEAAIEALPDIAARGGGRAPRVIDAGTVEREIAAVEKLGARYVFLDDADYPPLLAELDNAPAAITLRGDIALTRRTVVAMVGARNASAAACRFARGLAVELGREGVVVVSGLARGLDTAAHTGSLATGTIGVIASGIDISFPPENRALQEQVASEGLLIAEQPPGMEPLARNFPHRNRIIAGLALGTVVVEAAPRSGSLITARLANEAGRDVMAVPGSPLDPRAQGCNQLIRDGATLVQSAADILESIRPIDARWCAARAATSPACPPPIPATATARSSPICSARCPSRPTN